MFFNPASSLQLIWSPTRLIPNWLIGGLRAPSAGRWLSLPHLVSNWLNFLWTELYDSSTSTFFLWTSQIALTQPVHGQGYILIFLERMHLLFIQVHFLFWQPGRVIGQYATLGSRVSSTEKDSDTRLTKPWTATKDYRSYGNQTWLIKWNAVSSKQRSCHTAI